jgi:hypothetical protein
VRRHAKASSAASNSGQASRPGSLVCGALSTRGASSDAEGSGAPFSRVSSRLLLLCLATAAALAAFVSPALAITIASTSVSDVGTSEATLHSGVNPQGLATTYHFEYGTTTSYGQSTSQGGAGSDSTVHAVSKSIQGLAPGTTYHYRVVAENTAETLPGPDRTFTTYLPSSPSTSCPNQHFRIGASANLPDCRAYEMVSPVDKNGGDIAPFFGAGGAIVPVADVRAAYNQAAVEGDKITYSSGTPFGDTLAGRNSNQYLASRGPSGWSTHSLNAPAGRFLEDGFQLYYPLETAFRLFSPDLSQAWMEDANETPLTAEAAQGIANLYRRDSATGSYQALTTTDPAGIQAAEAPYIIGGHSSDYSDIVFATYNLITPDAFPNPSLYQVYDYADGQLHLVSILPDGRPNSGESSAGVYAAGNRETGNPGVVSDDGSRVFWTAVGAGEDVSGLGKVYLRENPAQPQSAQALGSASGKGRLTAGSNQITEVTTSTGAFAVGQSLTADAGFPPGSTITAVAPGLLTISANALEPREGAPLSAWSECTETAKACTIPVSESVPGGRFANFELANADGSKVLFRLGTPHDGVLYEFDVATRTPTLIANKSEGTVGTSRDGSRIYFVSLEDLAPGATAGKQNLYLDQEGVKTFVATLASGDVIPSDLSDRGITTITGDGRLRGNRVSPDGRRLVFMSESKALSEATAGYDNTDAVSGEADREVYIYDTEDGLRCVSCNPSGARPTGKLLEQSFTEPGHGNTTSWAAAWIPGWEHILPQRVLSDDGSRVFFNSYDALVPQDTDGVLDVYEWERPGSGECTESSSSFSELNGGCISLISSGQSPQLSEFVDATPNGSDVFFTTGSSLVKPDPGLVDIYDARVGGGFDYPTTTPGCEGETCQGIPAPPNDATPSSASYNGPANVMEAAKKKQKKKKQKKKGGKSKRANNSTRSNG